MRVPFLDLRVDGVDLDALTHALRRVLEHGVLVLGPEVELFEKTVAAAVGRKFAVGVSSGSDAVYLALRALGVGPGDQVVTPCLSWIATANAIARCGAKPVFADIGSDLNISVESMADVVDDKTRFVLSVDFTGRLCDYRRITEFCETKNMLLVEDGSQAFGAMRDGFVCGAIGQASAVSHNPMKVFAGIGEAGTVFVDDNHLDERLRMLRYNGTVNKEFCYEVSINGRIDAVQAAVLLVRLEKATSIVAARQKNARFYDAELPKELIRPQVSVGESHAYYTYTVMADRRDEYKDYLESNGIETKIQHPVLMSDQRPFVQCVRDDSFAKKAIRQILCLPVHERLSERELAHVVECSQKFFA